MSESPDGAAERWNGAGDNKTTPLSEAQSDFEGVLSGEKVLDGEYKINDLTKDERMILRELKEKLRTIKKVEELDQETTRGVERLVILRVAAKHINLWIRQLEIKKVLNWLDCCNLMW